jgi:hypothetical protein
MLSSKSSSSRSSYGRGAGRAVLVGLLFCLLFCGAAMLPRAGHAAGALAVALPPDVAKGGFSYGYSNDNSDSDTADNKALNACRSTKDATKDPKLRALCKVFVDYGNSCIAVSMDPAAGTPGVGWAIAGDLRTAEKIALNRCEATAGPGRTQYCVVDHSGCDGNAK